MVDITAGLYQWLVGLLWAGAFLVKGYGWTPIRISLFVFSIIILLVLYLISFYDIKLEMPIGNLGESVLFYTGSIVTLVFITLNMRKGFGRFSPPKSDDHSSQP